MPSIGSRNTRTTTPQPGVSRKLICCPPPVHASLHRMPPVRRASCPRRRMAAQAEARILTEWRSRPVSVARFAWEMADVPGAAEQFGCPVGSSAGSRSGASRQDCGTSPPWAAPRPACLTAETMLRSHGTRHAAGLRVPSPGPIYSLAAIRERAPRLSTGSGLAGTVPVRAAREACVKAAGQDETAPGNGSTVREKEQMARGRLLSAMLDPRRKPLLTGSCFRCQRSRDRSVEPRSAAAWKSRDCHDAALGHLRTPAERDARSVRLRLSPASASVPSSCGVAPAAAGRPGWRSWGNCPTGWKSCVAGSDLTLDQLTARPATRR